MVKIFVSYSSDDKTPVEDLVVDLESLTYDIWFDNELIGGQSWWDRILKEIENCDIYLCALSDAYLKSEACKHELKYAIALGKTIVPITVAKDFDERFLSPEISKLQITCVEAGDKKDILSLINALNAAKPSPTLPDPLPAKPAIPVSYLSELMIQINSSLPLDQDQQAALIFKLRDHFRRGGDATGVDRALDTLEKRKDLLANIGREVDGLRAEIKASPEASKPDPKRPEQNTSDDSLIGFGFLAFIFPIVGAILFFVWRKEKPKRVKVMLWASVAGFIFFSALFSDGGSGY